MCTICLIFCRVSYDRAPFSPTTVTLLLSAFWHGLYPAYYFMFVFGSISLVAARKVQQWWSYDRDTT